MQLTQLLNCAERLICKLVIAVEMTLYFMRGLAMEGMFRENDAHYDDLIERWEKGLRATLR